MTTPALLHCKRALALMVAALEAEVRDLRTIALAAESERARVEMLEAENRLLRAANRGWAREREVGG